MVKTVAILGAIVMGDNQIQEPGEHGGRHERFQTPGEATCWVFKSFQAQILSSMIAAQLLSNRLKSTRIMRIQAHSARRSR